ncbi:hypothetical protein RUND412_010392, partial [Rhizina undulata]
MVRTSARTRNKPTNYAQDIYKDLDSSDNETPIPDNDDEDDSFDEPENAAGGAAQAESERDSNDDDEEEDDSPASESESDDAGTTSKKPRARTSVSVLDLDSEVSAARVHRPHVFRMSRGVVDGKKKAKPAATPVGSAKAPDPSVRITYRPGFIKSTGKRERLITAYGENAETLKKALWIRDRWIGLPAIPERRSLGLTPFWREGMDEIVDVGEGRQILERVDYGEGERVEGYLPGTKEGKGVRCILGPLDAQKIITFKRFGIHDLATTGEGKKGFILNVGGWVLGMDWCANKPEGTQYLAVSTKPSDDVDIKPSTDRGPAFDRIPCQASIQIWRFPVSDAGSPEGNPSLALVLFHDWGPVTELKWCPIPKSLGGDRELGLLAGVFKDGSARVLKVTLPEDDTDGDCVFLKLHSPAFEFTLRDTVITTLAWISDHELVAGCANGTICTFDLSLSLLPSVPPELATAPISHFPLHQTFITSISTCYPSYPAHVITSSMDGYSRVTSLVDPEADTLINNRSRIAPMTICWVDAVNAAITSEEGVWAKFNPLRRFFSATTVCKHNGVVMSLAGSLLHSMVVSGGSEGEVVFSNPVRRTFHGKI